LELPLNRFVFRGQCYEHFSTIFNNFCKNLRFLC
jgi:hypothetical protein